MTDGLRPRPEVPADVRAAILDAAEQAVAAERREHARAPAWRFSARWFSAHPIRARSRPG